MHLVDTPDKYEAGSAIASDDQFVTDYDFYVDSPTSMVSLASQPTCSLDVSLVSDSSSHISTESVSNLNFSTVSDCSYFQPKRIKSFYFPTLLLSNIRGGFVTKLDELQLLLVNNNVDVAVITETWLHDDIDSSMLEIPEYMLFRLDRGGGRQGGGVAVYVKHGIPCTHLSHLTQNNLEVMWLLYRPHSMPREISHLLIGAVYFPPKANSYEMIDYLISSLDAVTRSHPCTGILLLGDFNQLPDTQLKSFPLQQIVTKATRGTSVLDKIYTNVSSWYQAPIILPAVSRSDHETILLQPTLTLLDQLSQLRLYTEDLYLPTARRCCVII